MSPEKFDMDKVLSFFNSHKGKKYSERDIRNHFGYSSAVTRYGMKKIIDLVTVEIKNKCIFYFVEAPYSPPGIVATKRIPIGTKEYVPDLRFVERCSEMYPEHKGFISFKGHEEETK